MAMMTLPETRTGADLVDDFAPLEDDDLREMTDDGSFTRGRNYFRDGNIFDPRLRGDTLRAQCHGSSGGPYLVEATLARADARRADNPVSVDCDCPRGGFCKHIVALLLTWIDDPAKFVVRPEIDELLAERSRDDLVALVRMMVERHPDLEPLLDLPLPNEPAPPGMAGTQTIDLAAIRRQTAAAFRDHDEDEWGAAASIEIDLAHVQRLGDEFAAAGYWANALAVYTTVIEETIAHYEELYDDEGEVLVVVADCCGGLARCLEIQADLPEADRLDPDARLRLIKTIFDVWRWDMELGGQDLSGDGANAIAAHATDAERAKVERWLREVMASDQGDGSWTTRAAIEFLADLNDADGLPSEELLEEYRRAGLWPEVVATLVQLDRVDEAVGVAARKLTTPWQLTQFADTLVASGGDGVKRALQLVEERLWEQEGKEPADDERYRAWLAGQYAVHGQPGDALAMERRRFEKQPTHESYTAVKTAAALPDQPAGAWDEVRPHLLETLRERKDWTSLIEIALEDGDAGEALAARKKLLGGKETGPGGRSHAPTSTHADARIAAAAERSFPDEAIAIYENLAARNIQMRGRPAYQDAASFLARVKALRESQGRTEEWRTYITDLRQTNKTLRALREELDALGLV